MKRVHIICEGQTEETFVNELLAEHLARFGVYPQAAKVGKPGHKGGFISTARMLYDIKLRLFQDRSAYCTTFFDFYGLDPDFAGRKAALKKATIEEKSWVVEAALKKVVTEATDENAVRRFIPYVQMYEFEGLLFSDPAKLAFGLSVQYLEDQLLQIRQGFASPEEINDSRATAPSKRLLSLMPDYEKPLYGSLAALEIGLDVMRRECKRFNNWITQMENLGKV
jgi:hypothetical protein